MTPDILPHDDSQHDLLDAPATQVLAAAGDALGQAPLLIVECPPVTGREALGEFLSQQAAHGRPSFIPAERPWVEGYLNLMGHPGLPARLVTREDSRLVTDLAHGVVADLRRGTLAVIDRPETMLHRSPARLGAFIRGCAKVLPSEAAGSRRATRLVVVLAVDPQAVRRAVGDEIDARIDHLLVASNEDLACSRDQAMSIIESVRGEASGGDTGRPA